MVHPSYPYFFRGTVVPGFGRGSRELGCPTANMCDEVVNALPAEMPCGVFYGLARVNGGQVHNMVMSIGWNPYYMNERKTVEVHVMYEFSHDLYGVEVECLVIDFLREMAKFSSLDELKEAIRSDISTSIARIAALDTDALVAQHFPVPTRSHM